MQIGVEVKIFPHAEIFIQTEALRHIADAILNRLRVGRDINAQYLELPFVGCHQSGHHPQQSGFTRAIGANQRRERACLHFQRDVSDSMNCLARFLDQKALMEGARGQRRRRLVRHCAAPAVSSL